MQHLTGKYLFLLILILFFFATALLDGISRYEALLCVILVVVLTAVSAVVRGLLRDYGGAQYTTFTAVLGLCLVAGAVLFFIPAIKLYRQNAAASTLFFIILTWGWVQLYCCSSRKGALLKETCLLVFFVAALIAFAEICFNLYANMRFTQKGPVIAQELPHPYLTFSNNPAHPQINALGFRGPELAMPKPAGRFRIACIGGSTTYGTRVNAYEDSYPSQLGRYLAEAKRDVDIVNAGVLGYSSFESLINLELRVLETRPDLIIIYHGVNDIPPRLVGPDYFFSDNRGFRQHWQGEELDLPYPRFRLFAYFLRRLNLRLLSSGRVIRDDVPMYDHKFVQEQPDVYARVGLSPEQVLQKNSPGYFKRNIENMLSVCRTHHTPVLLLSFAWSEQYQCDDVLTIAPHLISALKEHNRILAQLYEEYKTENVAYLDFAGSMPAERHYFADPVHFTEPGNRKRAEIIGQFILKTYLHS